MKAGQTDLSDGSPAKAPLADEEPELDHVGHPKRPRLAVPVSCTLRVPERGEMRADELHDLRTQLRLLENERQPEQRDGQPEQRG